MNDQNETAQLRFLEETAIRLRQNGFTVEPIEDHHLPVCWEKGRLCRISGNDDAGNDACDRMTDTLEDMGVDVERLCPVRKDWNDDLCAKFERKEKDA